MPELPNTNRSLITGLIAAVVAIAVVGAVYWFMSDGSASGPETTTEDSANVSVATGDVQPGTAPYSLVDMNGTPMTQDSFPGKYKLVFFGFSNCQDECPIALHTMADALNKLGVDAAKIQMIFITVDPTRDTPDVLKKYLANFDARIIGATGTAEQVKAAEDSFKAYASEGEDGGPDNEGNPPSHKHQDNGDTDTAAKVNHSDSLYFLSPQNGLLNLFNGDVDSATLANDIQTVLAAAMIPSDGGVPPPPDDDATSALTQPAPPILPKQ